MKCYEAMYTQYINIALFAKLNVRQFALGSNPLNLMFAKYIPRMRYMYSYWQ